MERQELLDQGFTDAQIEQIEEGKALSLNVSLYSNTEFDPIQMREIKLGLQHRVDAAKYADTKYDWLQMEQIRKGLEHAVDVSIYLDPRVESSKMREIRKGLEQGMNLAHLTKYSTPILREIRKAQAKNVDILRYVDEKYDADQLHEIAIALKAHIKIDEYINNQFTSPSIAQIREGVAEGVDVKTYATLDYSWLQMRELRLGMENRVDTSIYASPFYSWEQMREIRLGLEEGLDVSDYAKLIYPTNEMRRRHEALRRKFHIGEEEREPETPEEMTRALLMEEQKAEEAKTAEEQSAEDEKTAEEVSKEVEGVEEAISEAEALRREAKEAIHLTMDGNAMTVYFTIPKKRKVEWGELSKLLKANEVTTGINREKLNEIIEGKYQPNVPVLVAEGKMPHKGADGYYEFFFSMEQKHKPKVNEDGSVDYRNVQWFETVEAGQLLAYYHSAENGEPGYNVKGETIPAIKGMEQKMLTGSGFTLDEDRKTYRAEEKGMVSYADFKLIITKHLKMPDCNKGNLEFDGSVEIDGVVENGVKIKATGDIVINGTVGNAIIESVKGSVMLKQGMNAGGNGYIKAEGDVTARFLESVEVVAGGDIKANSIMNCNLKARGKIECAMAIVGGMAIASKGFVLFNAGNKAGIKTIVRLELDDHIKAEKIRCREVEKRIKSELAVLNKAYDEMKIKYPPEIRNTMELFLKVENAIYTKQKQQDELIKIAGEIQAKINEQEAAKIFIKGEAFEGSLVDIDRLRWYGKGQYNIILKQHNGSIDCSYNI
ncbi:MAG: FapA family protein [Acetatifactor sp.]|nr:FapA family protein [Acetatifactor sp.]